MTGKLYWVSPAPAVDDFGNTIEDEFVDGRSVLGPWGLFTPKSWRTYGCGQFGTGHGQKYRRDETGNFAKVEG